MRKLTLLIAAVLALVLAPVAIALAVSPGEDQYKVAVCHKPGTPAEKTLYVPESAVPGHIGHGDTPGECVPGEETPDPSASPSASASATPEPTVSTPPDPCETDPESCSPSASPSASASATPDPEPTPDPETPDPDNPGTPDPDKPDPDKPGPNPETPDVEPVPPTVEAPDVGVVVVVEVEGDTVVVHPEGSPEVVREVVLVDADGSGLVETGEAREQIAAVFSAGSASAAPVDELPETGGARLLALGAGALIVAGGLVALRIVR